MPLIILAGAEYGSGSSRDWAAKGTLLLGVKAVLATSFERIHRSNLIGMCVLPLQFAPGPTAQSLGLTGEEVYSITGLTANGTSGPLPRQVTVRATVSDSTTEFAVTVRIDTPAEADYYRHGGILQYVLRQLLAPTRSRTSQPAELAGLACARRRAPGAEAGTTGLLGSIGSSRR